MNRKFYFFIFLLVPVALSGQYQGYYSPDFWKKYTEALTFDLKLEPLSIKKTDFHFRLWNPGQVIDIWKDSSGLIKGEITSYAKEYDEMNLGKRTFYNSKSPIEARNASDIYQIVLRSRLDSIPAGDEINGWANDTGGFTNIIEFASPSGYSFKCYLSPVKQVSLKEANTIQSLIDKIENDLRLKKVYKSFSASIPFWCYTRGTTDVTCRKK